MSSLLGDHGPQARETARPAGAQRARLLPGLGQPPGHARAHAPARLPARWCAPASASIKAERLTQSNPRFLLREGIPRLARAAAPAPSRSINRVSSVPSHDDEGPVDRGLQEIVDALSLSLGRPVLIDDAELRPLAYSTQFGELDEVRTASILGRHSPDDARVALFDEGIRTAAGPVHIPARPEIGMRARVCVPLVGVGPPARLPVAVRGAAGDRVRAAARARRGGRGGGAGRSRRRRPAAAPPPRAAARHVAAEPRPAPGRRPPRPRWRPSTTCRCGPVLRVGRRARRARRARSGARRRWTACARGWRPSRRCARSSTGGWSASPACAGWPATR